MTQKRNSHSSVVSVEEESMDLLDYDAEKDDDSVDYIETDLGTDNIEDIITSSKLGGIKSDDFYMMDTGDSSREAELDTDVPKGVAVEDPVRLYLEKSAELNCYQQVKKLNLQEKLYRVAHQVQLLSENLFKLT